MHTKLPAFNIKFKLVFNTYFYSFSNKMMSYADKDNNKKKGLKAETNPVYII